GSFYRYLAINHFSLYLYTCSPVFLRPKSPAILHVRVYGAKIHTKKGYCLGIIQSKYSIPIPSPIQTVLSALEFHQIHRLHIESRLRTTRLYIVTTGRALQPATKEKTIRLIKTYHNIFTLKN